MIILGLTGSIGMGKTATAHKFVAKNVPVYDADAAVHKLYEKGGGAVEPLAALFPSAYRDGAIDRSILRGKVVGNGELMAQLEAIVHPLVGDVMRQFLDETRANGARLCVLDIPLLFENGGDKGCDYICVVTAPEAVQRERVLARGAIDEGQFEAIKAKQTPDADKRARADFIISTAFGHAFTARHVDAIIGLFNDAEAGHTG